MPQLNFYVPEDVAQRVKDRAAREGKPLSRYLAELVKRDVAPGWPPGFFERFAGKVPEPFDEPEDLIPEERD